ncbi:F0F1 ATP synthase subunit B [Maribacter sp. ACAM166]|uniref:F0F1 ATP synthase subunit B family protein n=1 Tax=Maribacter sp. ACAM166 TaxID=2508996 RepID=UPI0010FE7A89|nr:F0F1 ATP synthase subunit B [Maribacter sp. ACAM166]TLP72852.1 F0F1 ATP synthase subunit B [Maribacter sp. ACAM166]
MEINWFTVIAQIVNFLILVWLLKRFLYKPVLKAVDERKKKIEARLEDAAMRKAEAKKDKDLFRQKNEDFDKERTAKMNLAQEDVNSEKERLFKKVRNESNALRSKFENSFKQRKQELTDSLKRKTKDEVFAIVGKTLSDLANANLEDQVIHVFIKKIDNLTEVEKSKFIHALNDKHNPVAIKSVFDLSASSKQKLEKAIGQFAEKQLDFNYKLEAELLSGIEIETASHQMSWNIESYLDSLSRDSITM